MLAELGNRVLSISTQGEIEKYKSLGYTIKDDNGYVIHRAESSNVAELQQLCKEKDIEIANLKAQIVKLKELNATKVDTEDAPKKSRSKKIVEE